jgi:hypothetical protein
MLHECNGPCETCKNHYKGGCQYGRGYHTYDHATKDWIEMFRLRNARQRVLHIEESQ